MKNMLLKMTLLLICLPAVSLATVPKGGKAPTIQKTRAAQTELGGKLNDANLNIVEAGGLMKAMEKGLINASQVNSLVVAAKAKPELKVLIENTLAMVAAGAAYNMTDFVGANLPKVDSARDRAVELVVEVTNGAEHSVDSLNQITTAATDGYKSSKDPADLAGDMEAVLSKTATAEAKAESESKGKSLLELFGKCKSV